MQFPICCTDCEFVGWIIRKQAYTKAATCELSWRARSRTSCTCLFGSKTGCHKTSQAACIVWIPESCANFHVSGGVWPRAVTARAKPAVPESVNDALATRRAAVEHEHRRHPDAPNGQRRDARARRNATNPTFEHPCMPLHACRCVFADEITRGCNQIERHSMQSVTFANELQSAATLFRKEADGGPRAMWIIAAGGTQELRVKQGTIYAFARAGTLAPLVEHNITAGVARYGLTDADISSCHAENNDSALPLDPATCRAAASCGNCIALNGCGWSVVRHSCFKAHAVGTESDSGACEIQDEPNARTPDAWLAFAQQLANPHSADYGLGALRSAYRALERGADAATTVGDTEAAVRLEAERVELAAKLDGVFDEGDARELLNLSRHPDLAAVHSNMGVVPRRTLAEAGAYIARGEPVIITDVFHTHRDHPVAQKWTVDYLHRLVFGGQLPSVDGAPKRGEPLLNVATDVRGACCRYYEPRRASIAAGYPYPFQPRTRLYRDTFGGFVETLRAASTSTARARLGAGSPSADDAMTPLHYLHDTVMDQEGRPQVGAGPAPPVLAADLASTLAAMRPLATRQPFFGAFASAKLWLGQRGIVMPLHYDATDNLYVPAWGRKRAILAEPGQMDALYRFPSAHPHVGSSQVNISAPNLTRFPGFTHAKLREAIVGPGDTLYLPSWWWHQFEQPFEDTGTLNLWSSELEHTPTVRPSWERDVRLLELSMHDQLEQAASRLVGNRAGLVLGALAMGKRGKAKTAGTAGASGGGGGASAELVRTNETLHAAAEAWQRWARTLHVEHAHTQRPPAELVRDFLDLGYKDVVFRERWAGWKPGADWSLSQLAPLEPRLQQRCRDTPAGMQASFASICDLAPGS